MNTFTSAYMRKIRGLAVCILMPLAMLLAVLIPADAQAASVARCIVGDGVNIRNTSGAVVGWHSASNPANRVISGSRVWSSVMKVHVIVIGPNRVVQDVEPTVQPLSACSSYIAPHASASRTPQTPAVRSPAPSLPEPAKPSEPPGSVSAPARASTSYRSYGLFAAAFRAIELDIARRAQSRVPYVELCEEYRSRYNWDRCWASSRAMRGHIAVLRSSNTGKDARRKAAGYLRHPNGVDVAAEMRARLKAEMEKARNGLPGDFGGSKELARLNARADASASSSSFALNRRFLSRDLPAFASRAEVLRTQYPGFTEAVRKYRPWLQGCVLSKDQLNRQRRQDGLLASGKMNPEDQEVFVFRNVAFCEFPPAGAFDKMAKGWASRLPLKPAAFKRLIQSTMPKKAHGLVLKAARRQARMTVREFVRKHRFDAYLPRTMRYMDALSPISDQRTLKHPCAGIRKESESKQCEEAVNAIRFFIVIGRSTNQTGPATLASCKERSDRKSFQNCVVRSTQAWKSEAENKLQRFYAAGVSPDSESGLSRKDLEEAKDAFLAKVDEHLSPNEQKFVLAVLAIGVLYWLRKKFFRPY